MKIQMVLLPLIAHAVISCATLYAQTNEISKKVDFSIPELKPTMTGYQNKAVLIATDSDRVWVRCEDRLDARLVLAQGGLWARALNDKGGTVTIGEHAECIASPGMEVMVCLDKTRDDRGWFVGNIDYDSSEYSFVGSVPILGYVVEGLDKDPITFFLTKESGLTYVGGRGRVLTKDGDSTLFSN